MKTERFNKQIAFRFKRLTRKAYSVFNSMHRVINIGVVVAFVLAVAQTNPLSAQTGTSNQQTTKGLEEEHELDDVMVTASRVATPIQHTAKRVTVITQEQIAQAPIQSIQDLLVYVAHIDVIQRGGHGVQADISIRGGSPDQTAVLLNGINLSNAHTGHYSFDIPINISDIERIEIIQGPSALIYGASAFSGGINIITKKEGSTKASARIEAGMHKLRGIELRAASSQGIASNSLSVAHSASDGYISNSDYALSNTLWQTRLHLPRTTKIDVQLGYNNKKYAANTFYTPAYPNQYEQTSSYMATVKGEWGTTLKFIPIAYWTRHHDQFDLIRGTEKGRNMHRNDTYGGNLIAQYTHRYGISSMGTELRQDDIISSRLGKPRSRPEGNYTLYDQRTTTSLAAEHTLSLDKIVLSGGVLVNHTTLLPSKYSFYPSLSASYRVHKGLKIYSSWSKSTRIPTFTDLYYTTETHIGNEKLKPEKSASLDLGLKYKNNLLNAYITGFIMQGNDVIDWVKETKETPKWSSWNRTKINTQGVEMGVKFHLAELHRSFGKETNLSLDYMYLHQSSDTQGLISLYSLNYLRHKFIAQLHHPIGKGFSASWYFRIQERMGEYVRYEANKPISTEPYSSYSTLDCKLNYTLKNVLLNLSINNIYNTHYFDLGNIPQAGYWITTGFKWTL